MSAVRFNIVANIAGQAWTILLALACTPFYLRFLGIEAYGLIAFFLVLQSVLQLLDFGLGTTVNREIARFTGADASELASFIVTLEAWYWILGIALGGVLFFALPTLSTWWLRPEQLGQQEIVASAHVFSLLALLQWPTMFYSGGIAGLQKQVAANVIQIPFAAVASIGGLVFIWLGPRSVAALLAWQAGAFLCQLLVIRAYFWSEIGIARVPIDRKFDVLRKHWRFSLGMSAISITGLALTHLDKLILSRLLPLEVFGHYSLAGMVARGLYVLIAPVFSAYFPRLSLLVARGDNHALHHCYHTATQVMAVLILPMAGVIALFPKEILSLWLRDAELATAIAPLAALLVVGTCLNGLMNVPFALQLAHGNTRIGLSINLGLVAVLVPSIILVTIHFGAVGAASMWVLANAIYLAVGLPVTHRFLVGGELTDWLLKDILPPLLASMVVVGIGRWLLPSDTSATFLLVSLLALWFVATFSAFASSAPMRAWGLKTIREFSA